ncbi:MAG: hypothetical protein KGY54_11745 [Oleiphilaceae bacterium]|nr:hypothetical protein [Oleiphilaceae bacterium]
MKISLAELRATDRLVIDFVEILSLEGQRYMARLRINDDLLTLSSETGETLLFRGSSEAKNALSEFEITAIELVHPSAYDEMIGLPAEKPDAMRIPLTGDNT